jgi:hypothetical protein
VENIMGEPFWTQQIWWNVLMLGVIALTAIHNYKLARIKRNDDLFKIRYDWYDTVVTFSGEISNLLEEYENFIRLGDGDPSKEEYLSQHAAHVHNKIQRHLVKGLLIFNNKKMDFLFKDFGEATNILHSEKTGWLKEWSKFLLDLFEINKLFLELGPEINLKKMK